MKPPGAFPAVTIHQPTVAGGPAGTLGRDAPYLWAATAVRRLLHELRVPVTDLPAPEQLKHPRYAATLGVDPSRTVHIGFSDPAAFRPLKDAYNVVVCLWPYPELRRDTSPDVPILMDQLAMLKLADEVWTPSPTLRDAFEALGVMNCRVMPIPILPAARAPTRAEAWAELSAVPALPLVSSSMSALGPGRELDAHFDRLAAAHGTTLGAASALASARAGGGRVMLAIAAADDDRDNVANLIEGFLMGSRNHEDAVLILRWMPQDEHVSPERQVLQRLRQLFGHPHCLCESRVLIVGGSTSAAEAAALYAAADVFLYAGQSEAQNLPLLEAVARGVVTVAPAGPDEAGSADAVGSVRVSERPAPERSVKTPIYGALPPFPAVASDRFQVASAVERALDLDEQTAADLRRAAVADVEHRFGAAAVSPRWVARLMELGVERSAATAHLPPVSRRR